jgi:tetraacyldisaccharide 4'-kinase
MADIFLKSFRLLLFPFSLLYGLIISIRNLLYDQGLMTVTRFNVPVICVGNLSVGGTGKSPMVEYLLDMLSVRYRVATLSRGYRRRTRGYVIAGIGTTAIEIGDEPMQFHQKFPDVAVAVGERRVEAIPQLLYDRPETEVIILDDAFQHRSISAGINILLTDFSNPYSRDFFLPAGDLRDARRRADQAEVIIVTKCPAELTSIQANAMEQELGSHSRQSLFFSSIVYGIPYALMDRTTCPLHPEIEVLLICGIANPEPLKKWLECQVAGFEMMRFKDHHIFNIDDLKEIRERFHALQHARKLILTTEKDAVRLHKFGQAMADLPIFVLPIRMEFLFDGSRKFRDIIDNFIDAMPPVRMDT